MSSRRTSRRPPKRKNHSDEVVSTASTSGRAVRSCDKAGCIATEPICCLNSNENCTQSGYTSRWYHMSLGEHFCNNCFDHFYRPYKSGNAQFNSWTNKWSTVAKVTKPNIKIFIANEILPYWIKCTNPQCGKWRKVLSSETLDSKYIEKFKCPLSVYQSCDVAEDKDVALAQDSNFMSMLAEKPLLKKSPAASSLAVFLPEDIGMCPLDEIEAHENSHKFIKPFINEQCGESPIWVKPGKLDDDEIAFTRQVEITFPTYLGIRNLIYALWIYNPSEWLTMNKVHPHLVCRGLVRIYLIFVAEQVVKLLTNKAVINYGIIVNPSLHLLDTSVYPKILVVGAGVSGLAAAAHLQNLGLDVTVYEADSEIGGRVKDPKRGLGSETVLVQGLTNNPFSMLAIQAKDEFHVINDNYVVFESNGKLVPGNVLGEAQQCIENFFQGIFESPDEYVNKSFRQAFDDNMQTLLSTMPNLEGPDIIYNLLALKEIKVHANLSHLSPLYWEHPTSVQGEEGFISNGLRLLLLKLSRGLEVQNNHEVLSIDYTNNEVIVKTTKGEASFGIVLITVPLPVLQSGRIKFEPPLPPPKQSALKNLLPFYCELLILEFPKRFWNQGTKESFSKFGLITPERKFEVFFDVTGNKKESIPTLIAYIPDKSLDLFADKPEQEIVTECMMVLQKAFGKSIPSPSKFFLTKWKKHPFGGNFGTYIKTGTDVSMCDDLAASVDDRLYFAGEATFRNIPSTVTGAYLSGLREAANIAKDLEL